MAIENPLKNQETRLLACYRRKGLIGAGKVRKEDLNKLLENPNCGICKHPLEDKFHIDHIIPVSKGGKHELSNLQLAHPLCNLRKGAKVEIIAIGK
jgi:5-methylcytosine-specific restriction endonuclease McrA